MDVSVELSVHKNPYNNEFFSLSEYIKIDVGWGFASGPTLGANSAPQTL